MKSKIWLSPPHMGGSEMEYIHQAFITNWISPVGPNVDGFESDIANYMNVKGVAALSSGTSAIHLALILLGVKQDDFVICSSFTFSASVNPVTYLKAIPVLIDCESDTWNMDPGLLREAIINIISNKGKKPKAIILVHLYGMPAKIDELLQIGQEFEIPIIEDAAEALGSKYHNQAVGTFGDIGILSFNGNKIITTSGGGALISNKLNFIKRAKFLATQARDEAPHYQHTEVGYNYRMSNVLAGIGRGQLKVLNDRVHRRRKINSIYREYLSEIEGIDFQTEILGHHSNYWLTTVLISPKENYGKKAEDIRYSLEEDNIESRPLWKPMHLQPVYNDAPKFTRGISDKLFYTGLCLPSGSSMTDGDITRVVNVIRKLFRLRPIQYNDD